MKNIIRQILILLVIAMGTVALFALTPALANSPPIIDDNDTVILHGNVNTLARPEFDHGETSASLPMERMILTLKLSPEKQAKLDGFLSELHDQSSPNYRQWITPEEFGERFGPATDDIDAITRWLSSHGFVVEQVAKGRTWINFSGTVADVERTFHTQIHEFDVKGRLHHANVQAPSIPRGLADLVVGIVSLNDFPRKSMINSVQPVTQTGALPNYTSGSTHYLSPGDFATIYNVNALYNAGIDGIGQSIAIVGRTHPSSSDWSTFRSIMGLSSNSPQVMVNGPDPGDLGAAEDYEADLDVEWSGAVAPNAAILFVVSKSTYSTDGVDLSAQYIVDNNLAPVMSTSFGECESDLGSSENNFYNNLWQQAVSHGITSFVSAGDAGAAGCNSGGDTSGSVIGVNGLASTQYNVAVGGTEFNEGSDTYWNTTNGSWYTSAISYIPEIVWNESGTVSGGSDLWSTGGGFSSLYSKPAWQVAPGVPIDGKRDMPDVSLSAAKHDAYLIESQGGLYAVGGTSASTPSFAGLMGLIVQKTGQRQGNANARFYQLGNAQYGAGGVAVFHDTTSGNNSVPGVIGYSSTTGYDLCTGLGSVDANALVKNWTPDFTISASPATLSVAQGAIGTSTISTTVAGNFSNAVSLSAFGLPTGVTAIYSPSSIPAPGSGNSTLKITVATSAVAGTYPITVTGIGGSTVHSTTITLNIIQVFAITATVSNGVGGTITPASTSDEYGTSVTFTMIPYSGYTLTGLTDNGVSVTAIQNPPGTFTYTVNDITANQTVQATFSPIVAGPAIGPWGMAAAACGMLGLVLRRRGRNHRPLESDSTP